MDKDLKKYTKEINNRVETLESSLDNAKLSDRKVLLAKVQQLYDFHVVRVRDFQHERIVHLLVTFFFAGILLPAVVFALFTSGPAEIKNASLLNLLAWVLAILLFLTVLFYVRHYYQLENGTQRLYKITARLQELLDKSALN
jgi:hypothetical protein